MVIIPGGLFQQDDALASCILNEWFEEYDEKLGCAGESMAFPLQSLQGMKDLLLISWSNIPQDTFRDPDRLVPFRQHVEGQKHTVLGVKGAMRNQMPYLST